MWESERVRKRDRERTRACEGCEVVEWEEEGEWWVVRDSEQDGTVTVVVAVL